MKTIDYFLVTCLIFVVIQSIQIIFSYTKRGSWEPVNKIHAISSIFYPVYLGFVVFMSMGCNHSDWSCDIAWKISCTLYIFVTMAVYFFYLVKSKISRSISWKGKAWLERLEILMIIMMGVMGLGFFWLPIKDIQYNAFLIDGVCRLVKRQWIPIIWSLGDTVISVLLLWLFIKPLKEIEEAYADTPKSIMNLKNMKKLIKRTRNLLIIAVVVTFGVMLAIAIEDLNMLTVHYLCAIDRLVTLQSITLTFWNDGICCFPAPQKRISMGLPGSRTSKQFSSRPRISKQLSPTPITKTDDSSRCSTCCPCLVKPDFGDVSSDSSVKNPNMRSLSVIHMCDIEISNLPKPVAGESRSASFRL